MKLDELIQERDAYGGKILKLGISIAVIFILPVLIIAGISYLSGIRFIYLFPIAFIVSWTLVVILYKRVSKKVKTLDKQIQDLRAQKHHDDVVTASENTLL